MESIDPQQQWRELRETYGQMTEEELCAVAEDASDLTPVAKEALQAAIAERGLKIQLAAAPPPLPPEPSGDPDDELISVRQLRSESEARQAKAILDANFVASCLGPDNVVDLEDFKGSFDSGVDLKVFAVDSRRARDMLALYAPQEEEEDPDDDKEYAVLCPKCHSQEVFLRDDGPEAEATAVRVKFKWQCDACGHQWEDEGIEAKL